MESLLLSRRFAQQLASSPPYEATLRLIPRGMTGPRKRRGREGTKRPGREQREKEGRPGGGGLSLLKATPASPCRLRARARARPAVCLCGVDRVAFDARARAALAS